MSKAVSARYRNVCPKCKAKSYEPCRTLKTGRVTDTHMQRVQNQFNARTVRPAVPDAPVRIPRYFPVERVITESNLDTLALVGYGRSKALSLLMES